MLGDLSSGYFRRHPVSTPATKQIQGLRTAAIDAMNGYEEALEKVGPHGLSGLLDEMSRLHRGHADELAEQLRLAGETPGEGGSIMSTVNRVIMDVRSLVGELDASILPGLIDGEKRNIARYDEVLASGEVEGPASTLITRQRLDLGDALARMQKMSGASEPYVVL